MAETSMVEKVARALAEADSAIATYEELARAAIEAMGDPTEEMIEANWSSIQNVDQELRMRVSLMSSKDAHQVKAKCRWRAMIDAALNGKEG